MTSYTLIWKASSDLILKSSVKVMRILSTQALLTLFLAQNLTLSQFSNLMKFDTVAKSYMQAKVNSVYLSAKYSLTMPISPHEYRCAYKRIYILSDLPLCFPTELYYIVFCYKIRFTCRIWVVWLQLICKICYNISETYWSPSDILQVFLKQSIIIIYFSACRFAALKYCKKVWNWTIKKSLSWMVLKLFLFVCIFIVYLYFLFGWNY